MKRFLAMALVCILDGLGGGAALQAAQGKITPPGTTVTYDLPAPTARFVSRSASYSSFTSTTTTRVQIGLSPFPVAPFDDTYSYKKMVVSDGTSTTTAIYKPGANPDDFYFPDWEITNTGLWGSGEYGDGPWEVTTAFGPNMELFLANATSVSQTSVTVSGVTWTLSDPVKNSDVTTTTTFTNSSPWSDWEDRAPSASRFSDGQGTSSGAKAEYRIAASPALKGKKVRWTENLFPADGSAPTPTTQEWIITDTPSSTYSLNPGSDGTISVSDLDLVDNIGELAVDANRDGAIKLANEDVSDATSAEHPYRFWLNDDIDRGHTVDGTDYEQDDISPTEAAANNWVEDWKYNTVQSRRDLEDFSRIVVSTSGIADALRIGDLYLGLKWTDTVGTPSIKLYKQYDATGGLSYLTDDYQASVQLPELAILNQRYPNDDLSSMTAHTVVTPGDLFVLPQGLWIGTSGDIKRSLLFEGCTAGKGQLKLVILKRDGSNYTEIGDGPGVWLDLKNIKDMYEHWTVGQGPVPYGGGAPSALSQASSFTYAAQSPEEAKYILYVHGWNMEQWEKERFAETAYKRLYWQGYKGRFGLFSWPTTNGFDGTASAIKDSTNYDRGEFSAWRSASLLEQKLAQLNGQYPGQVHLLAHSMGNVVAGEALRRAGQDGLGVIVRTYVASQGALPVHCYNGSLPDNLDADVPASGIVRAFDGGWPQTANAYKSWLAANSAAVAKRVNFFNINDYALWRDIWQLNQWLKPDHPDFRPNPPDPQRTYYYLDDINQPPTQDGFGWLRPGGQQVDPTDRPYLNNTWYAILRLGNAADVKDRYDIMAMACESRSKALGATSVNEGLDASLWLGSVWPADPSGDARPYSRHKWHSAEFRSTNMLQKGYWQALLGPQGFNIITPP